MARILRAAKEQQSDHDSTSGPGSYSTGGFSIRTNLGRVDEFDVDAADATYEAQASVSDNNALVVEAHAQDGTGETAAGTDLSGVTFHYSAYRL